MKNLYFFCLILAFFITSIFSVSALCINSADNYAAEVLLNKEGIEYNLDLFKTAQNVLIQGNKYILQSEYNPHLALILEKQTSPLSGLSVRLQIPVESEEKNIPLLKFSSTSSRSINTSAEENYNGWDISCLKGNPVPQCEFSKEATNIVVNLVSNKYDIIIETQENLGDCKSCDGRCFVASGGASACFNKRIEGDVEDILKHMGLISSINEIFSSYKIINLGNVFITDLSPAAKEDIDWNAALKTELIKLRREAIISITEADINQISNLAAAGKSGQNSRIVYGEDKNGNKGWLYYSNTKFPQLTHLENCNEFPASLVPTGFLVFSGGEISTYYLVPLILTISLIVLLSLLIITARLINKEERKRKLKPITGLQSAQN